VMLDMPLAQLEEYRPPLTREGDFEAFWAQTLAASQRQPLQASLEQTPYPVERVTVHRVTYDGFGPGTRVAGWYITPQQPRADAKGKTPAIVVYHGYSGSRGAVARHLHWALQGFIVFAVDTRGQNGETPDNHPYPGGAAIGHLTKGIEDPHTYYYRYAYMDCVRAVDFLRTRPEVGSLMVMGRSQGGALALAAAALAPSDDEQPIVAAMPDVPFLSHFARAVEMYSEGPYDELVAYWRAHPTSVARDYRTLSYFDAMNLAPRVICPTLLSVGLLDPICPPSTAFAVYHHLGATDRQIAVYPFADHDGGDDLHTEEQYRFVRRYLKQQQ